MKHSKLSLRVAAVAFVSAALVSKVFGTDYAVSMNNFSFSPSSITIGVGDSVTWTNIGGTHTATSGTPPGTPDGLWDSGTLTSPSSFTVVFTNLAAQTYPYYCTFHFGTPFNMTGSVTLTNGPQHYVVTAGDFLFTPATLTINQGDTVTWTNIGGSHTTTSGTVPANTLAPDGLWNGSLPLNASFSLTFNGYAPRTYPYYCTFHGPFLGMIASLTVTNASVPPPPTLSRPALSAGPQFSLSINGLIGQKYAILFSPDLLSWSPVSTNIALSANYQVTNLSAANPFSGFYRAQELP